MSRGVRIQAVPGAVLAVDDVIRAAGPPRRHSMPSEVIVKPARMSAGRLAGLEARDG